jgi:NAD(P)-dependent dehydrogenase (short-subunit alcohol dehydrogenase family)
MQMRIPSESGRWNPPLSGRRGYRPVQFQYAPGYINTEMVQAVPKDVLENRYPADDSDRPPRRTGRDRALRRISRRRRFRLDFTGSTLTANGAQYIT